MRLEKHLPAQNSGGCPIGSIAQRPGRRSTLLSIPNPSKQTPTRPRKRPQKVKPPRVLERSSTPVIVQTRDRPRHWRTKKPRKIDGKRVPSKAMWPFGRPRRSTKPPPTPVFFGAPKAKCPPRKPRSIEIRDPTAREENRPTTKERPRSNGAAPLGADATNGPKQPQKPSTPNERRSVLPR